jgi:hypothetical protein
MTVMTQPIDPHPAWPIAGVEAARERAAAEAAELVHWRAYDLQWQIFHRLRKFNVNHASQAYRHRYRTPLGSHALAYLFQQPAPNLTDETAQVTAVRAATRIWKAGPEAAHPIPLMSTYADLARKRDPRIPWDLRTEIANRCDDGMADDAVYVGLGYSTLDTPTGTFTEVCQAATSELDLPGVFLYVASGSEEWTDQQVIVAERRGPRDHNLTTIHTYRGLRAYQLSAPYPFAQVGLTTLHEESGWGPVLRWMWELDRVLHDADATRRALQHQQRTRRRRPS